MLTLFNKICDKLGLFFSFLNRENSPSNKLSLRETTVNAPIQQAGRDIHNNVTISSSGQNQSRPQIDSDQWAGSGEAEGYFVQFYVKNIGNAAALDVAVEFLADDSDNVKIDDAAQNLLPGQSSRLISYRYDQTHFFTRALKNPRIIFTYKSGDGRLFVSGRSIVQKLRADGRFDIHRKSPTSYFDNEQVKDGLTIELEQAGFNLHNRLKEGLAGSFSTMVSVFVKNRSQETILIRNVQTSLKVPDGYRSTSFYTDFNYPNGRNINGREFLPCKFGFSVSIDGGQIGKPMHETPAWVENKDKLLLTIDSAKIIFRFRAESVTLDGVKSIDKEFDLTDSLLAQIMKP